MPSPPFERRLHPVSFVFKLAAHLRQLVLPGLIVLIAGARGGGETWQVWAMVLFLPFALVSVAQALVFRYRLDAEELVLQGGLLFRQQRHIPYERIQNIDALQNVVHRLFGVVDVRIETAGGQEPEAHLTVLSAGAFEELRAGVHARRGPAASPAAPVSPGADESAVLLRLPGRELVINGLIQGRGLLVIAALFGLLFETGLLDRLTGALFGDVGSGSGVVRRAIGSVMAGGTPWRALAMTAVAFAALMAIARVFSVAWSIVRLHGFSLRRSGDELRTDFGLFTRVAATIPLRRIQSVTVTEGPLHRLFGRLSVRVDTAGSEADESVQLQRQWLAPVLRPAELPALLGHILPALDLSAADWQPVDPRGTRRMRIVWLVRTAVLVLVLAPLLEWMAAPILVAVAAIGEIDARRSVRALGWGATDEAVLFRSGWIWRRRVVAPVAKVQTVAVRTSPFDRRLGMARVEVDTAGTQAHRISVPYLSGPVADRLAGALAAGAARTAFRW